MNNYTIRSWLLYLMGAILAYFILTGYDDTKIYVVAWGCFILGKLLSLEGLLKNGDKNGQS